MFKKFTKKKLVIIYLSVCIFSFVFKLGCLYLGRFNETFISYGDKFIDYTSPTIVIAAIALVLLFSQIKINHLKKFISIFSPTVFGVYLIHVQPLVFGKIITGLFSFIGKYNFIEVIFCLFGLVLIIYFGCFIIDYGRLKMFELFKIRMRLDSLEKRLNKYL